MRYNSHGPFLSDQDDPDEKFLEELQPATVANAVDYPSGPKHSRWLGDYLDEGEFVQAYTARVFKSATYLTTGELALLMKGLVRYANQHRTGDLP